jgi:hypothetical protein
MEVKKIVLFSLIINNIETRNLKNAPNKILITSINKKSNKIIEYICLIVFSIITVVLIKKIISNNKNKTKDHIDNIPTNKEIEKAKNELNLFKKSINKKKYKGQKIDDDFYSEELDKDVNTLLVLNYKLELLKERKNNNKSRIIELERIVKNLEYVDACPNIFFFFASDNLQEIRTKKSQLKDIIWNNLNNNFDSFTKKNKLIAEKKLQIAYAYGKITVNNKRLESYKTFNKNKNEETQEKKQLEKEIEEAKNIIEELKKDLETIETNI